MVSSGASTSASPKTPQGGDVTSTTYVFGSQGGPVTQQPVTPARQGVASPPTYLDPKKFKVHVTLDTTPNCSYPPEEDDEEFGQRRCCVLM